MKEPDSSAIYNINKEHVTVIRKGSLLFWFLYIYTTIYVYISYISFLGLFPFTFVTVSITTLFLLIFINQLKIYATCFGPLANPRTTVP
jgi:hypothetical protein